MTPAPEEPGFYKYNTRVRSNMIFLLDRNGQWWAWFFNGEVERCEWAYIEQALSVWDLVPA